MSQRDSYARQRSMKEQTKWIERENETRLSLRGQFAGELRGQLEQAGLLQDPVCAADVFKTFQHYVQRPAPDGWEIERIDWMIVNISDLNDELIVYLSWHLQQEAPPPPWATAPYYRQSGIQVSLVFEPVSEALRGIDRCRWEPPENMPWLWHPRPSDSELEGLSKLFWTDLIGENSDLLDCLASRDWKWNHR
jgi:hypothetical protein